MSLPRLAASRGCGFSQTTDMTECGARRTCIGCKRDSVPPGQECVVMNAGRCSSRVDLNGTAARGQVCAATDAACHNCTNAWSGASSEICTGRDGCLCVYACAVTACPKTATMALSSQAPVRNQAVEHMCDFTQSYNPPSSCAACVTCKDNAPSGQECVVANSGRCVSRSSANISTANELCDSTDPFCRNCVNEWGSSAEICTGTGGCLCSSACAVAQCRPGTRAPLSGPVPVGTQLSGSSQRQTRALSIPAMIVLICLVVLALLALLWIGHYFRQRRRRLEREQLYERQQTPRAAPRSTRSGPTAPLALEGWTSMRRKLIEDEHARFGVGDEQSSSSGRVVEEATVTVEHGGSGRTHPVERGTWV